eukprot:3301450-Heterocapsa_arctica.AAC.1
MASGLRVRRQRAGQRSRPRNTTALWARANRAGTEHRVQRQQSPARDDAPSRMGAEPGQQRQQTARRQQRLR